MSLLKSKTMPREVFTLTEGEVTITCPDKLSSESLKDLKDYLDIFLRKAQRLNAVDDPHDAVIKYSNTAE